MGLVDLLETRIAEQVAAITGAAAAAPAGGGAEWDALLLQYGVTPLDVTERAEIVSRMRLTRGAVPAELRLALATVVRSAQGELARVSADSATAGAKARLEGLVDRETESYERALCRALVATALPPAVPSLQQIFANAGAAPAPRTDPRALTLHCIHCGAPQEKCLDFLCRYCRRPMA
jgi:hypothetical protein